MNTGKNGDGVVLYVTPQWGQCTLVLLDQTHTHTHEQMQLYRVIIHGGTLLHEYRVEVKHRNNYIRLSVTRNRMALT